jgi:hypothetical protein
MSALGQKLTFTTLQSGHSNAEQSLEKSCLKTKFQKLRHRHFCQFQVAESVRNTL